MNKDAVSVLSLKCFDTVLLVGCLEGHLAITSNDASKTSYDSGKIGTYSSFRSKR